MNNNLNGVNNNLENTNQTNTTNNMGGVSPNTGMVSNTSVSPVASVTPNGGETNGVVSNSTTSVSSTLVNNFEARDVLDSSNLGNSGLNNEVNSNVGSTNINSGGLIGNSNSSVDLNSTTNPSDINSNIGTDRLNSNSQPDGGEGAVVNENLKTVEVNYQPPSKFKMFMMVLMFVFLIVFIIFLPDITSYVNEAKSSKKNVPEEIITTGRLECELESNTTNLDMKYERVFEFTDSKIDSARYKITTRGDVTLDEAVLDEANNKCLLIKNNATNLSGVSIDCDYKDGKLVEEQRFDLRKFEKEKVDAAFSEAGGTYPAEFSGGDDIRIVEKTMLQAGYSCMRKK